MADNDDGGASNAPGAQGNRQVEQGKTERRRRIRLPAKLVAVSWRDLLVIGLPAGEYYVAAVTRLEPGDLENRQFLEDLVPAAMRLSIANGEKKTRDLKLAAGG